MTEEVKAPEGDRMALHVGITDDILRVYIAMTKNGDQLGWIELTPDMCDSFIGQIKKYQRLVLNYPRGVSQQVNKTPEPPSGFTRYGNGS